MVTGRLEGRRTACDPSARTGPYDLPLSFTLGVITYMVPLPENALKRLDEVSLDIMNVLIACVAWLVSFLP